MRHAAPKGRALLDVLTCIREKRTLATAGRLLAENAERHLKAPKAMAALFADRPDLLRNAEALAERLSFTLEDLGYRFPDYPVPEGETQFSFLCKATEAGARERYRPYHEKARRQIERELALIGKLNLAGYFLIVWDLVNFCRREGILAQGRGSAANSAVCYSLGITAVDPVGMELLFERFLSEERGEWPDIDLDLPSGDRRERVIQHVYERYGAAGAAMTANVITYRDRSASREIGKVLGIPEDEIDRLAQHMRRFEFVDADDTLESRLERAGLDRGDRRIGLFARLFEEIQDLPRHLGQHSGGMVVAQGRLDEVVPLEPASMPGRVIVQWDKEDCADLGIIKVDLLGLGMMSALQDALALLRGTGVEVDLAHLPPDDPKVYAMLRKADTVGVFQVESRAQMATLPRMKPDHFYDLVVEVAIIRPGPIVGKMVHPYLRRRNGQEPVGYLHPSLEPILKRTLGVPLFQEQLLRIAMTVAGFTGGEAEELRRAMGFKRSEKRMKAIEARLRSGMAERGITGEAADTIVLSISSFALYGFPESHAASFALIAYASAFLKCHHPAAFTCALLNNQPMGFYHPFTLVKDAQRHGVRFRAVDVTRSGRFCGLEEGEVRLGLGYVRGLRAGGGGAHRGRAGASALRVAAGLRRPHGPAARRAAQPGRGGRPQRLRPDAAERPVAGREGPPRGALPRRRPEGFQEGPGWSRRSGGSLVARIGRRLSGWRLSANRDGLPGAARERPGGDRAHRGPAPGVALPGGAGRAGSAAGGRAAAARGRGAGAGGRGRDLPAAAGDGGGIPLPDPRGRDGPRERDREAGPLPPRARGAGRRGRSRGGRRPAGERRSVGAGLRGAQGPGRGACHPGQELPLRRATAS